MKTGGDISSLPADGAVILLAFGCRATVNTDDKLSVCGFSLWVFPRRQNTEVEIERHASLLPEQETD